MSNESDRAGLGVVDSDCVVTWFSDDSVEIEGSGRLLKSFSVPPGGRIWENSIKLDNQLRSAARSVGMRRHAQLYRCRKDDLVRIGLLQA